MQARLSRRLIWPELHRCNVHIQRLDVQRPSSSSGKWSCMKGYNTTSLWDKCKGDNDTCSITDFHHGNVVPCFTQEISSPSCLSPSKQRQLDFHPVLSLSASSVCLVLNIFLKFCWNSGIMGSCVGLGTNFAPTLARRSCTSESTPVNLCFEDYSNLNFGEWCNETYYGAGVLWMPASGRHCRKGL